MMIMIINDDIMMIMMTMDENGVHGYAIYIYTYCTTVHIKVELTWSMVTLQVALLAR